MKSSPLLVLACLAVLLGLSGCTTLNTNDPSPESDSQPGPMHGSLDDLTRESVTYCRYGLPTTFWAKVRRSVASLVGIGYYSPWEWNTKTLISASGSLPMPGVGVAYHWSSDASPRTALPINVHGRLANEERPEVVKVVSTNTTTTTETIRLVSRKHHTDTATTRSTVEITERFQTNSARGGGFSFPQSSWTESMSIEPTNLARRNAKPPSRQDATKAARQGARP